MEFIQLLPTFFRWKLRHGDSLKVALLVNNIQAAWFQIKYYFVMSAILRK
jgi:hypothetical protein